MRIVRNTHDVKHPCAHDRRHGMSTLACHPALGFVTGSPLSGGETDARGGVSAGLSDM